MGCRSVDHVTGELRPQRLRVVIGEDSVLLLAGLVKLLESAGFEVAATAGDATELLAAVDPDQVAGVVLDAIRSRRFYILPHPGEALDMAEQQLRWIPRWWRSCWCAGAVTRWTT